MAKYTINCENLSKVDGESLRLLPMLTMKVRGCKVARSFTALDEGDGRFGGIVVNPISRAITGVWEWTPEAEANVRFLSFKEKDEQGNYRLHRGGLPVCNALRAKLTNQEAA